MNSLVFVLASSNKLDEAEKWYAQYQPNPADHRLNIIKPSTGGLPKFPRGQLGEGRRLYNLAIQMASSDEHRLLRAIAAVCMAREETVVESPTMNAAIERATKLSKGVVHPGLELQVQKLVKLSRQ